MAKVVILCGGMGTRLREETEFKPKPMVDVGGMPLLWHIMKIHAFYGHKEFVLPLGYKGDMIKQFFVEFKWRANDFSFDTTNCKIRIHKNHKMEDWIIHFVDTGLESGTSFRLFKVKYLLDEDEYFLLTYGDGVADIDLNKLIDFHKKHRTLVTLTGINQSSRYGIIKEKNGIVTEFSEKPTNQDEFISGGFMVMNKEIFKYLSDEPNAMIAHDLLPKLTKKGQVSIYKHRGFWYAMDTYREYLELNKIWNKSAPWKKWKE